MGLAHSPRIVTDGLVLALDANNSKSYSGSGTTWSDLSGNGNNATLTNNPSYLFNTVNKYYVFNFDGTDDYCTIASPSILNSMGSSNFTISFWVYRQTLPPTGNGEMLYQSSDLNDGFVICLSGSSFRVELRDRQSTNGTVAGVSNIFTADTWTNVVLVKNSTTYTGYSQGISKGSFTGYADVSTTANFVDIGRVNWWGPSYWEGNIATVSAYNKALSAEEVQQNFNAVRGRFGI